MRDTNFKIIKKMEFDCEELWDFIATRCGFDSDGLELQGAIRKFVKLKAQLAQLTLPLTLPEVEDKISAS